MKEKLSTFAKKSLGQNFLKSERALSDIVEAGDIKKGDTVIEIGPGEGALTTRILEAGADLTVVEKDDRLIPVLQEKYAAELDAKTLEIIHGDIIELFKDENFIKNILKKSSAADNERRGGKGSGKSYKIIANIPYYITGLILRNIFDQEILPEKVVLLVQKEVADRMVALGNNGMSSTKESQNGAKESLLSLSVKLYGTPKRISVVPKGAFVPAPSVDSAIISIENISRKITKEREKQFFDMIHAAFSHKRKRLAKNLESLAIFDQKISSIEWEKHLEAIGLDKNIRAEDISVEKYIQLLDRLV